MWRGIFFEYCVSILGLVFVKYGTTGIMLQDGRGQGGRQQPAPGGNMPRRSGAATTERGGDMSGTGIQQ